MKYGKVQSSDLIVESPSFVKIAKGTVNERPSANPRDGMIRYNTDLEVVGVGENSGFGRFELYTNGEWTPFITTSDIADERESIPDPEENVTLRILAGIISDFFVNTIGFIEVNQFYGTYGFSVRPQNQIITGNINTGIPSYIQNLNFSQGSNVQRGGSTTFAGVHAILEPIIGTGRLDTITVSNPGTGYQSPPAVIIDNEPGVGAQLQAVINNGEIISVNVVNRGSGYSGTNTLITIRGNGVDAKLTPVVNNGEIVSVTVNNGGSLFTEPPLLTILDKGFGAFATAQISGGQVTSITIVERGRNFLGVPIIRIVGGGGLGATAVATLGDGKILDIDVLVPGSGYNTPPAISITSSTGSGASASASLSGGGIDKITVTAGGSGYKDAKASVPDNSNYFFQEATGTNVILSFEFNVFDAAGVPTNVRDSYSISLFQGLFKIDPLFAPYSGQAVRMAISIEPKWSPAAWPQIDPPPGANDPPPTNYGVFVVKVELFGQRYYYGSGVGAGWFSSLTRFRNF